MWALNRNAISKLLLHLVWLFPLARLYCLCLERGWLSCEGWIIFTGGRGPINRGVSTGGAVTLHPESLSDCNASRSARRVTDMGSIVPCASGMITEVVCWPCRNGSSTIRLSSLSISNFSSSSSLSLSSPCTVAVNKKFTFRLHTTIVLLWDGSTKTVREPDRNGHA